MRDVTLFTEEGDGLVRAAVVPLPDGEPPRVVLWSERAFVLDLAERRYVEATWYRAPDPDQTSVIL